MALHGLNNPFLLSALDDTAVLPPGDVPELHSNVLARCCAVIAHTRQSGRGVGLLATGEAGTGKSHLIAQFRYQMAAMPDAALAAIPLRGAYAGRLWRHLRERMVSQLLAGYPISTNGLNGLDRVLRNRFPKWASAVQSTSGGLLDWLIGRAKPEHGLQKHLDEFAATCEFDYGLQKVLPKVGVGNLTVLAYKWLRGDQLGGDDLIRLGLAPTFPSEQEQEKNARNVVLSLLRLGGDRTVLVFCFDEVEAIQAGTWDAGVLREFTTLAVDLLAEIGPRAVITFVRPNLLVEMQKTVEIAHMQKAFHNQAAIPPLSWEQAVQVARFRLDAEPTCQAARRLRLGELDWPLGRRFLEDTFQANPRGLTPRHLIMACRDEFDRLQNGTIELPPTDGPDPPKPVAPTDPWPQEFTRTWDGERSKLLKTLQGVQFDTVMAIGLPWLVQLSELPYVCSQHSGESLGDVNLLFHPQPTGRKALGVSFCNQQPRSLWPRLDRLKAQWKAARAKRLGELLLLRSAAERTTDAAQQRLDTLEAAGVRVLLVEGQQLAELAAYQGLLTKVLEGNVTQNGKPAEADCYYSWCRGHLSGAVKELLQDIFGAASSKAHESQPAADRQAALANAGK